MRTRMVYHSAADGASRGGSAGLRRSSDSFRSGTMSDADDPKPSPAAPDSSRSTSASGPARDWEQLKRYFPIVDFAARPRSRAAWIVRAAVTGVALFVAYQRLRTAALPLLTAKPIPSIPTEEIDDYRFRLPERTRREMFTELATAELAERARAIAQNTWNGQAWSREDDRGHYERVAARSVAHKYKVSLSQVYLVLDEGIRSHWPAPDGNPLPATTPPLSIRSNSW